MTESGEAAEIQAALFRMRRASGLPIAFGGLLDGPRQFRISEVSGNRSNALRHLAITTGNGLGGKAVALAQPLTVTEYGTSRAISHEYDAAVVAEGMHSVIAVPVIVRRRVRGVLYGALREPLALGDRPISAAVDAARELEQCLAVRDEAQRLMSTCSQPVGPVAADQTAWEEVREAHLEIRTLAARVTDPLLRQQLLTCCGRLATAAAGSGPADSAAAPGAGAGLGPSSGAGARRTFLTPRETDVIACVATGATNAGAADRLGLRPETVKSYLRSAMRKLGAHNRMEAVVAARRAGLLP